MVSQLTRFSALVGLTVCVSAHYKFARAMDIGVFERLGRSEKIALIQAAFDARDVALGNFSCRIEETRENFYFADGRRRPLRVASYELRRIGGKLWMYGRVTSPEGELKEEAWANWDGRVARTLNASRGHENLEGIIKDREDGVFYQVGYTRIIGFRPINVSDTLSDWLRKAVVSETEIVLDIVERQGKQLSRLSIPENENDRRTILLDVSRDFVPVYFERRFDKDGVYSYGKIDVEVSEQIGDVWVPTKVVFKNGLSFNPEFETQIVYTISDGSLGSVKDDDLVIAFPPGTRVVDNFERRAYRVLDAGATEELPVVDAAGRVLMGGKPSGEEVPKSQPKSDLGVSVGQPRSVLIAAGIVTGIAGIVVGVVVVIAHRRRTA